MAFVIADRVRETTTSIGTGSVTLAGAYTSFQTFSAAIGNGNNTYYTIASATSGEWEVGIGTYASGGNLLSRDTVLASSAGGAKVTFSSGTKDVFVTQPAERSLLLQSAGTGLFAGAAAFTANGLLYANSTTTVATGSALTFDGSQLAVNAAAGGINMVVSSSGNTGSRVIGGTGSGLGAYFSLQAQGTNAALIGTESAIYGSGTSNNLMFYGYGSNSIIFAPATAEGMRLTSTGLGIGTSSPGVKLDVVGAGTFKVDGSGSTTPLILRNNNTASTQLVKLGFDSNGAIKASINAAVYGNDYMTFNVGSDTERMRLDASGNLGIGTSSPSGYGNTSKLVIQTTSSTNGVVATFANSGSTGAAIQFFQNGIDTATIGMPAGLQGITFAPSGTTERMRLDSSGNLGIGTSSPTAKLDIGGIGSTQNGLRLTNFAGSPELASFTTDTSTGQIRIGGTNASAGNYFPVFYAAGAERMRLDSSGNLGIGTSSPAAKLEVNGSFVTTADASGLTTFGRFSSGYAWSLIRPSSTATGIEFRTNAGDALYQLDQSSGANKHIWYTTASEKMRLDSSGNLIQSAPTTPPSLSTNGTMVFNLTSNTNLRVSVRGSDGVTRTANLTLA